MPESPPDLHRRFGAQLVPVARTYMRHLDRELSSALAVSHSTALAVMLLGRMGDGVRQGTLAEALGVEPASLVPLVERMERSGVVERHVDESDKRARLLSLTAAGRVLAADAEARSADIRAALLVGIDTTDLRAAIRVLDALQQTLDTVQG